jgi:hypothetical protein
MKIYKNPCITTAHTDRYSLARKSLQIGEHKGHQSGQTSDPKSLDSILRKPPVVAPSWAKTNSGFVFPPQIQKPHLHCF